MTKGGILTKNPDDTLKNVYIFHISNRTFVARPLWKWWSTKRGFLFYISTGLVLSIGFVPSAMEKENYWRRFDYLTEANLLFYHGVD